MSLVGGSFTAELYRDAQGHAVWRVYRADGSVEADGIQSDHDMQWLLAQRIQEEAAAEYGRLARSV